MMSKAKARLTLIYFPPKFQVSAKHGAFFRPKFHSPDRIADLLFDPYRDLAYQMKALHVIESTQTNFGEFMWANYLRKRIPFPLRTSVVRSTNASEFGHSGTNLHKPVELEEWCRVRPYDVECLHEEYKSVMDWTSRESVRKVAVEVCQSTEAQTLPGFLGKKSASGAPLS